MTLRHEKWCRRDKWCRRVELLFRDASTLGGADGYSSGNAMSRKNTPPSYGVPAHVNVMMCGAYALRRIQREPCVAYRVAL